MLKKMRDFFVNAVKVLYVSSRKFFKNDHTLQATALTYYTLFAVVPILALLFGIAKGFSLDDKLKSIIAERFAEQQNIVQWMYKFADTTLRNADGGIIAGIGVLDGHPSGNLCGKFIQPDMGGAQRQNIFP